MKLNEKIYVSMGDIFTWRLFTCAKTHQSCNKLTLFGRLCQSETPQHDKRKYSGVQVQWPPQSNTEQRTWAISFSHERNRRGRLTKQSPNDSFFSKTGCQFGKCQKMLRGSVVQSQSNSSFSALSTSTDKLLRISPRVDRNGLSQPPLGPVCFGSGLLQTRFVTRNRCFASQ